MIIISRSWLHNPVLRAEFIAHFLGAALFKMLVQAHDDLAEQQNLRDLIEAQIRALSKKITSLDGVHDSKARGLYYHLNALAESTDDVRLAEFYRNIRDLLFPDGLSIVQSSYLQEAGAIEELERRVTREVLEQLDNIRVGEQTLADVYRAWVEAGRALGESVQERGRLKASISRAGSSADQYHLRPAREQWIRVVHSILDATAIVPLSDEARESLMAPLELGFAEAERNRNQPAPDDGDVPDDSADTGDVPDAPADTGDVPDNNADNVADQVVASAADSQADPADAGDTAEFVPPAPLGDDAVHDDAPPA